MGEAVPGCPGWADLRDAVMAAVGRCEAAVAALGGAAGDARPFRAAQATGVVLRDLAGQVTRLAWDDDVIAQAAARAYDRGYAAGFADSARRRVPPPRRAGPRPPWPRAAGD